MGSSRELSRLMMGRSWRPTPTPWPNCSPKASISFSKPNSGASGQTRAIWSVVTPGLTNSMAASIHSRDCLKASRCAEVARPTTKVR